MEIIADNMSLCCSFCIRSEEEIKLVDMESNSLKYGSEILEFGDLLNDLFNIKVILQSLVYCI